MTNSKLISRRAILQKVSTVFAVMTVIFWACALLEKRFQTYPWAVGAVYGVALLFLAFGFLTIFWAAMTRAALQKNKIIIAIQVLTSFVFFSIGGPLVLSWLTLRASKNSS